MEPAANTSNPPTFRDRSALSTLMTCTVCVTFGFSPLAKKSREFCSINDVLADRVVALLSSMTVYLPEVGEVVPFIINETPEFGQRTG
jgi:hypothetical protein